MWDVIPGGPAFVIVYVNNESIGNDVWFDDLNISYYSGGVLEQHHYYPFGLTLSSTAAGANEQPYKYNTKELERHFGLETYEYGARQYDPQIGRFKGIDLYAEKYTYESPYVYAGNNPVKNIDVGGKYKMDAKQASQYSVLSNYLQNNVQSDIVRSNHIMEGFAKYSTGNLTRSEVVKAITWGSGPTVKIVDDPGFNGGANGRYDDKSKTIYINSKLAKQLESASSEDIEAALYGVFTTLTHETVHYGDYLDGKRQEEGEPGSDFMYDVFYSETKNIDGNNIDVIDPGVDYAKIQDAKKMIEMNKRDRPDVIPTIPNELKQLDDEKR